VSIGLTSITSAKGVHKMIDKSFVSSPDVVTSASVDNSTPVDTKLSIQSTEENDEGLDFEQGEKDLSGNIVRRVFARRKGKYIIYETMGRQIIYNLDESFQVPENRKVSKLLIQVGDLVAHTPILSSKYNSSRAYAMKTLFDGDVEGAEDALHRIIKDMTRHLNRRAKISYQIGAATMMILALTTIVVLFRLEALSQVDIRFIFAVVFSSMGGLMSVASSTKSIKVELQDSFYVNMTYGAFRIVIAMIAGIIVCFLIEAGVIFSFLKGTPELNGFIIASFLSGFSEKLIPNLFRELEEER
jgi:hypothetical protein